MSVTASDPFDALLKRAARLTPVPGRDTDLRGRSQRPGPRALAPGSTLWGGRFQIVRRLGAGGMGVVYEAQDQARGERIALKTLSRLDANGIYRLKQEFRALSEVAHHNLIVLHELFADDDHCLFTMELVLGEPFDRYVRPMMSTGMPALNEAHLRDALPQLARGVAAIHGAGKLHRDLKPSNVLVTPEGRVVILDFGLVADRGHRSERAHEQASEDDRGSGTPAYMAPEQCARRTATEASDWYAVGVMLFEALTGRLPFADPSQVLMRRKQNEEAPAASAVSRSAPIARDLEELCTKLLAREPSARPSGEELLELLLQVAPPRASLPPRAPELLGRTRELAALQRAFERARERAIVVCLAGESGMGKTALSAAFGDEARGRERAIVLEGRCYEREYLPYKGLDRAIDGLTRHLRQLEASEVAALLPPDIGALARIFPVLDRVEAIASTPTPLGQATEDAPLLRRRAFSALTELLARLGQSRPLILSIDDAQWIDGDSVALIDHILGSGELHVLVIVHQRSFEDGPLLRQLGQRLAVDTIEVGPLDRDALIELARRRLDALPELRDREALAASIAAEAQGSPFFAAELSRNALASTPPQALPLDQALRARTSELGDDARELLELLALAGRPTPANVLGLAATHDDRRGPGAQQPQRTLDRLRKAQLLRESPGGGLECYHDRVRIALVEGLGTERARTLHARLAHAWSAQDDADPEVLFAHCYAAGQRTQAAMHALHAAQTSAASLAFDRSASFLQHALELLPQAEITAQDLRARYAEALSLSGRWADASVAYERAARSSGSGDARIELLRRSAVHLLGSGHGAEGLPRLREVFVARGVSWPRSRWLALLGAFGALLLVLPRIMRDAGRSLPSTGRTPNAELEPLLEGAGLVTPYDMPRGVYFLMRFAARALRGGDEPSTAVALAMLSSMLSSTRSTRALSLRLAESACERARVLGASTPHAAVALTFAAYTRLVSGELREALALGIHAEELLGPVPRAHSYQFWNARTVQSMALVLLGRMREARARYEATGRLARELGDDLAVLGGESPLRFLVVDDAASARALVARKQAMLGGVPSSGALHRVVAIDRLMCALYEGTGADLIWPLDGTREPRLFFFDATVLHACCALQGVVVKHPRAAEASRLVRRALRSLAKLSPTPGVLGMAAQLRAALCLMKRDEAGAREQLERAVDCYTRAEMSLHAALMRCRRAELDGDTEAVSKEQAALHAMGITNPSAWAHMLSPGLVRP
jgi:tetratricopeptide (TPR) repeat protein